MLHLKAIEIIGRALRLSVKGVQAGMDDMALGQYIAGMGFSNVGLGLVHGMAHPLGAFYGTAHGVANAVLLPHIMAYNAEYTGEKYRHIAAALGVSNMNDVPISMARKAAIDAVFQLNSDVGIPASLREVGMLEADIDALAEAALADICTGGNPREAHLDDIKQLYRSIY